MTDRKQLFEELVLPNRDYLKRFAITVCRDADLAGDILQDAMVLIWRKLEMILAIKGNKTHYMCSIVLNLYRNYCRSKKRRPDLEFLPEVGIDQFAENDVEGDMMQEENRRELLLAINRLRPDYARLLILYYYYDRSFQEISETFQVNYKTVVSWHYRAKKQLAAILEEEGVEEYERRKRRYEEERAADDDDEEEPGRKRRRNSRNQKN